MNALSKILLALIYLLVIPVRLVRAARGRDTLQLRRPAGAESYWVVRGTDADGPSYFSEASVAEGRTALRVGARRRTDRGAARLFTPLLRAVARLHAPPRERAADKFEARAEQREQGIPDEVYTLW